MSIFGGGSKPQPVIPAPPPPVTPETINVDEQGLTTEQRRRKGSSYAQSIKAGSRATSLSAQPAGAVPAEPKKTSLG